MDATHTTGWWTCSDCGAEAELPASDTSGFRVPCPDCAGALTELWSWDGPRPARPGPPLRHAA
ncbi:MAG: hypothetical protein ACT4RN_09105 [Pseudonocardia sp.]